MIAIFKDLLRLLMVGVVVDDVIEGSRAPDSHDRLYPPTFTSIKDNPSMHREIIILDS